MRKEMRVFVVDDEDVIAKALAMILTAHGFFATPFNLPLEALQAARFEAPDLLITDVAMPLLSGIDLAIEITTAYPACKVLLFSGHAGTADLLRPMQDRGYQFDFLPKPVHPTDLLARVELLTGKDSLPAL